MDPLSIAQGVGSVVDFGAGLFQGEADRRKLKRARRDMLAGIDNAENSYTGAYDKSMGMYDPYVEAGLKSFQDQQDMNANFDAEDYALPELGDYQYGKDVNDFLDPSMQYQLDKMNRSTEGSAAAAGGLLSGKTLKALQANASGLAQTDFGNAFNRMTTDKNFGYQDYLNKFNSSKDAINQKYNLFKDQYGRLGGISDRGYNATGTQANLTQTQGQNMAGLDLNRGNVNGTYQMKQGSFAEDLAGGLGGLVKGGMTMLGGMSGATNAGATPFGTSAFADNMDTQWQNTQANPYGLQAPNSRTALMGL